jgi:hypothetical protein
MGARSRPGQSQPDRASAAAEELLSGTIRSEHRGYHYGVQREAAVDLHD